MMDYSLPPNRTWAYVQVRGHKTSLSSRLVFHGKEQISTTPVSETTDVDCAF